MSAAKVSLPKRSFVQAGFHQTFRVNGPNSWVGFFRYLQNESFYSLFRRLKKLQNETGSYDLKTGTPLEHGSIMRSLPVGLQHVPQESVSGPNGRSKVSLYSGRELVGIEDYDPELLRGENCYVPIIITLNQS